MRVTVLGSGSRGNATLLESGGARLLIDAGIPPRTLRKRLKAAHGRAPEGLDAILVTHAHKDHGGYAAALSEAFDAPVYCTPGARRGLKFDRPVRTRIIGARTALTIAGFHVRPIPVPHDAPQIALIVEAGGHRVGHATDLGRVPDELLAALRTCDTVMVESNYDPEMLRTGPYPPRIQQRVRSDTGHLENGQTARLLETLDDTCRAVVLLHLSEKNNTPELALDVARRALTRRRAHLAAAPPAAPLVLDAPGRRQLCLPL